MSNQHRQNNTQRQDNHKKEYSVESKFRPSVHYPVTNAEPVPEKGELDKRKQLVVICRNNPNHIISHAHLDYHRKHECNDRYWMPGKYIRPIPVPPVLEIKHT